MFENAVVAGIPEGYEFVAYRVPKYGELYLDGSGSVLKCMEHSTIFPVIVVQKEWLWPKWLVAPYIAMDKNGDWYAYDRKPEIRENGVWGLNAADDAVLKYCKIDPELLDFSPPCQDWTESLRANPNLNEPEVRVFDRELSADEVRSMYHEKEPLTRELIEKLLNDIIYNDDLIVRNTVKQRLDEIAHDLGVSDEYKKESSWTERCDVLIDRLFEPKITKPKKVAINNLVYLAVPYSHSSKFVRNGRFHYANRAAVALMKQGYWVFSPISHSHYIAKYLEGHEVYEAWREFDEFMIAQCSKLIVLMLPGWYLSKGVQSEIAKAQELGIPVEYHVPEHLIPGYSEDYIRPASVDSTAPIDDID